MGVVRKYLSPAEIVTRLNQAVYHSGCSTDRSAWPRARYELSTDSASGFHATARLR